MKARILTSAAVFLACVLLSPAPASAQGFDPKDLEWKPKENPELEMKWHRPKHPKWRYETQDVGNNRTFIDKIIRAESPSAKPDMNMLIYAWAAAGSGGFKPMDFPPESKDNMKSIISKDPVLAMDAHREFGNSVVAMFAEEDPNKFNQRDVLDKLLKYKKNKDNGVKKYGKELDRIIKLHGKDKYITKVPFNPGSSGTLATSQFEGEKHRMRGKMKVIKPPSKIQFGDMKGKSFIVNGTHKWFNAKVTQEWIFFSQKARTVVIRITYFGGMENNTEIKLIKRGILNSFKDT